jgi:hypothetical protein
MKTLLIAGIVLFSGLVLISSAVDAKPFKTSEYSVNMPNGCKTEREENRFSDDAFFKCKNMGNAEGNFAFEMAGAPYTGTDAELPDQLMTVISDKWSDPQEVERGTDKYVVNNQTAPYVIATFKQEFTGLFGLPTKTEDWAYMVVGVKLGDDMLYAQYKNDANHFDKQLPIFEKVLKSIQPVGSSSAGETNTDNTNSSNSKKKLTYDPEVLETCKNPTGQAQIDICEMIGLGKK